MTRWALNGNGDTFLIRDHDSDAALFELPYIEEPGREPLDTESGKRAKLAAAAPEMLTALKDLREWAARMGGWESSAWDAASAAIDAAER